MSKSVFGLAKSREQAQSIIEHLNQAGFRSDKISYLAYDRENRYTRTSAEGRLETNPEYFSSVEHAHAHASTDSLHREHALGTEPLHREYTLGAHKAVPEKVLGHEIHSKAPEGATTGGIAGGLVGGGLGLLAGLGALAIPGIGPFIAAGPIMAALAGSGAGGLAGLLLGGAVGGTMTEVEAKNVEKGLKDGHILVSVEVGDNSDDVTRAEKILKDRGATDICSKNC